MRVASGKYKRFLQIQLYLPRNKKAALTYVRRHLKEKPITLLFLQGDELPVYVHLCASALRKYFHPLAALDFSNPDPWLQLEYIRRVFYRLLPFSLDHNRTGVQKRNLRLALTEAGDNALCVHRDICGCFQFAAIAAHYFGVNGKGVLRLAGCVKAAVQQDNVECEKQKTFHCF